MSTASNRKEGIILSIIFSLGRVISYIGLGMIAGLIGNSVDVYLPQKYLGIFFVILGIAVYFNVHGKCIMKSKWKITSNFMALVSGIVFGAAPCPPLVGLLGLAVLSRSVWLGGLMGLVFGVGTIISPLIILGLFSGWFAKQTELKKVIPYVSGAFLTLLGLAYIIWG